MSVNFERSEKCSDTLAPSAKKTGAKRLRVGATGDSFEREADRVADRVMSGAAMPEWSFARVDATRIQRDPTTDALNQGGGANQQQAPKPNNYNDAAKKLGEAFLKTDVGKKLEDALKNDPLVKDAEAFVGTLPGKIVVGAAATAAVSTLAAAHQPLPVQIPEIPLDAVKPGLKVKLTYEGPVDKPTKAMITFSYSPEGGKKKKEPTASQKYLAETAPIAASMDMIRAGMRYAPGTPEAKQDAEDQKNFNEAMARRIGALPGTGGVPLVPPPSPQMGQTGAGTQGWTFSPFVSQALDKKIGLQPLTASDASKADADQDKQNDKKKPEDVPVQRKAVSDAAASEGSTAVDDVLDGSGEALDSETQQFMEKRIGFDFSKVRVHTDSLAAQSARGLQARAYTVGQDVVFGAGEYDPRSAAGRSLLAHELTHVVQQGGAERHAPAMYAGRAASIVQRKISMRDVGRGEQSGFARVQELIDRINAMSTGLTFAMDGGELKYTVREDGTLSNFDTQMQGFIDQAAVIPLRFTNRHGLLGSRATGFNDRVAVDDWSSGYVDIEDLLASNDLGLQNALVHFLRERTATGNYAHRIGDLDTDPDTEAGRGHQAELDRAHAQGIQAELAVLRDFFSDPTIRLIDHDSGGDVFRVYRNSRRDTIRTRVRTGRGANAGVDAVIVEVVTRDGHVHTPEEYKEILAVAAAAQNAGAGAGAPAHP